MKLFFFVILGITGSTVFAFTKPQGCGSTKGCYTDCDDESCTFAVTWSDDADVVAFSLQYQLPDATDHWIALGLSADTEMGDDSVTDCLMENAAVNVYKSYNLAGTKRNEAFSGAQRVEGLTGQNGSVIDGVLTCTYKQSKVAPTNQAQLRNLTSSWYLLVASGTSSNGVKIQHSLSPLPSVSPDKVNLQDTKDIGGVAKSILVKLHGCLMMYAWIFAASIGIVLARHYKPMWPNSTHCREHVWFTWHRVLMLSAFLTCVAAFVLIFIEVKAWSYLEDSSRWQKAHPYIGVVVTAFCVVNPIMALLRPHPDVPGRKIFNWLHWFVGTVAHILATLTMIIGVTLARASLPFYLVWILLAYAIYQVLMELFLEIFDCCIINRGDRYYRDGKKKSPRGSRVKKFCLFLHVLIITAFAAACIVITVIN